ncbi:MAG: hypothetical protein OEU44_04275, partial [Gammaproteobacteria bacterium]|nr:hypothetical protein [Gammaproteobacteria bacterium]
MNRYMNTPGILPALILPVVMATTPQVGLAGDDEDENPFDVSEIFFELNNTDGDLGIHALIDGDAWKRLKIMDHDENMLLNIKVRGHLKQQGLTEIFFESAEPSFESDDPDEVALSPEEFFERFPAGIYEIKGLTLEGEELGSETEITHVMPAPPVVTVNDLAVAENCDAELPVVSSGAPVTISWEPVIHSHPEIGIPGELVDVVNYEVVVEIDETPYHTSTVLPNTTTTFEVPDEILALGS